jgi:GTP-binding protein
MRGMERFELDSAAAGNIVTLAGCGVATVGDTVCGAELLTSGSGATPLQTAPLSPPTVAMTFSANSSPLVGTSDTNAIRSVDGQKKTDVLKLTASQIKERLNKEVQNNVTIELHPSKDNGEAVEVHAKGELQLAVLIEEMRREGFELTISPPTVLTKKCEETGRTLDPFEEVLIEVDAEFQGRVIERMGAPNLAGEVSARRAAAVSARPYLPSHTRAHTQHTAHPRAPPPPRMPEHGLRGVCVPAMIMTFDDSENS